MRKESFKRKFDLDSALAYAINTLTHELSPTLKYHSLWHSAYEVANQALYLATEEKISDLHKDLVHTAVLYHDIGFIISRNDHEKTSAQIAAEVLPRYGYTPDHINLISGMILSTQLPQKPKNLLERIVSDADLDLLGRNDFIYRNNILRKELALEDHFFTDETWYRNQLMFLKNHHYFTKTAIKLRAAQKQKNYMKVNQICIMLQDYKSVETLNKAHAEIPHYLPL